MSASQSSRPPHIIVNDVLFLLVYKTATVGTIDEIIRILNIAKQNVIEVKNNRHSPRVTKRPRNKLSTSGKNRE
jgi:hypothetical protein